MKIMCSEGILCSAEQLVIMAANTGDFDEVIDYVMCELEGYNEEWPPHTLVGVGLYAAMFRLGICSNKTWRIHEIDRELLDMLLDVAEEACSDVDMSNLIEIYVGCMLASGQWIYPL